MRAKEFIVKEAITPTPSTGVAPGQIPGDEGQDVGKLTATVTSLQKQIQDLQKAALQQSSMNQPKSAQIPPPAPKPGEGGQAQTMKGTIGAGQQTPTIAQGQAKTPLGQPNGQPMGQAPVIQQAPNQPQTPKQAPGVTQPPQITDLKIKQALSRNQGGGH